MLPMKKVVVLITFFSFAAGVAFGQFSFGPKLGYNASKLSSSLDSIKSSYNSGMHFGAFFRFEKKAYVQPEVYYTFQGSTFESTVPDSLNAWKQKVTLGTLDIPILVGFKIINLKKFNWRIMAGPMVSFVVSSKIKDVSLEGPIRDADISKVNWYIQAGTGFDLFFLALDVRYQAGLNPMIKTVQMVDATGAPTGEPYNLNATGKLWVVSLAFKL
jgi:hypothetical protein